MVSGMRSTSTAGCADGSRFACMATDIPATELARQVTEPQSPYAARMAV